MDRGEDVIAHDALGNEDRVLEVITIPRHEGDERVLAEREFAQLRRGTVSNDIALLDEIAFLHQRPLIDAGRLVRTLELLQVIDVDARLRRIGFLRCADNDTRGVDLIDNAGPSGCDGGTGVARHHILKAGADKRRLWAKQRHGLPLHVRTHQGAVRVVILEERHERRGH